MQGVLAVGIFGSDKNLESSFANSIAKKGESEGSIVYHRNMGQTGFSFLDDATFPERIQRDARIASTCDHAFLIFPRAVSSLPQTGSSRFSSTRSPWMER